MSCLTSPRLGTYRPLRNPKPIRALTEESGRPPDVPEIGTRPESPISVPLTGPSAELGRFDQSDEEPASSGDSAVHSPHKKPKRQLRARRRGRGRYRMPIRRGRSHADMRMTRRHKVPGLRERSPSYRVMEDYANLPAQKDPSNGSGTTST
jgi:hypothetical protein